MVIIIEHLHSQGIVYRDLKPVSNPSAIAENYLLVSMHTTHTSFIHSCVN